MRMWIRRKEIGSKSTELGTIRVYWELQTNYMSEIQGARGDAKGRWLQRFAKLRSLNFGQYGTFEKFEELAIYWHICI